LLRRPERAQGSPALSGRKMYLARIPEADYLCAVGASTQFRPLKKKLL
jgi:hypothetical protein